MVKSRLGLLKVLSIEEPSAVDHSQNHRFDITIGEGAASRRRYEDSNMKFVGLRI